jgi:hypothetical protein
MARKTAVLEFSVSPALAKEYEQIAAREGTTKSDLFRRMVTTYKSEREEEDFFRCNGRWRAASARRQLSLKRTLSESCSPTADEGRLRHEHLRVGLHCSG